MKQKLTFTACLERIFGGSAPPPVALPSPHMVARASSPHIIGAYVLSVFDTFINIMMMMIDEVIEEELCKMQNCKYEKIE